MSAKSIKLEQADKKQLEMMLYGEYLTEDEEGPVKLESGRILEGGIPKEIEYSGIRFILNDVSPDDNNFYAYYFQEEISLDKGKGKEIIKAGKIPSSKLPKIKTAKTK